MINIALCDDEPYMLKELFEKISNFFDREKLTIMIEKFSSGKLLLQSEKKFDIIFLDIQMKEMDGMKTARILRERQYQGFLIFITILQDYVFDSFEVQAFDYLIKPLEEEHFMRTMKRLCSSIRTCCDFNLLVQKENESSIIPFDDIIFCEVINRKIYLHLKGQKIVDYYEKMENLEKKLDTRFFKCHRSYLINLKYLQNYKAGIAYLNTGETIPVSRSHQREISDAILQYMKKWIH